MRSIAPLIVSRTQGLIRPIAPALARMCGGAGNSAPGQGVIVSIPAQLNGNGAVVPTGIVAATDLEIPFGFLIRSAEFLGDQVDTAHMDIWIKPNFVFGTAPPTVANSICNGNYLQLVAQQNAQRTGLAALGWTLGFARGAYIRWNLRDVTALTFFTAQLTVERTN